MSDGAITIQIEADLDIVAARQAGRRLADELGFSATDGTLIATAVSEIARNILSFATRGEIWIHIVRDGGRLGLEVVGRDHGPGIADVERAMQDGYSTRRGTGLGLPGARRLMDDFTVETSRGGGTTVVMRKWLDKHHLAAPGA